MTKMQRTLEKDAKNYSRHCRLVGLVVVALLTQSTPISSFTSSQIRIRHKLHPHSTKSLIHRKNDYYSQSSTRLSTAQAEGENAAEEPLPGLWPCFDELDGKLIGIALPVILNFAIAPLIGAVDLFWINRMGNALAVAGQAAANQVFNSAFWLASFLPSVTATFVSTENAAGNQEGVQDAICQAMFVGMIFALLGGIALVMQPNRVLSSVLKRKSCLWSFGNTR
jgi:MatE